MTDEELSAIAENNEHAEWIVETHVGVGDDPNRQRCPICEQWWPCELLGLAALAVLNARRAKQGAMSVEAE